MSEQRELLKRVIKEFWYMPNYVRGQDRYRKEQLLEDIRAFLEEAKDADEDIH